MPHARIGRKSSRVLLTLVTVAVEVTVEDIAVTPVVEYFVVVIKVCIYIS